MSGPDLAVIPHSTSVGDEHLVDGVTFRRGMRSLAGAVCIIASGPQGQRGGLTATAVCSVTVNPPRLLVCIHKTVGAHDLIDSEGRFAEGAWSELLGVPVLMDASSIFVARVSERIAQSTHTLFLCDVLAAPLALRPTRRQRKG